MRSRRSRDPGARGRYSYRQPRCGRIDANLPLFREQSGSHRALLDARRQSNSANGIAGSEGRGHPSELFAFMSGSASYVFLRTRHTCLAQHSLKAHDRAVASALPVDSDKVRVSLGEERHWPLDRVPMQSSERPRPRTRLALDQERSSSSLTVRSPPNGHAELNGFASR